MHQRPCTNLPVETLLAPPLSPNVVTGHFGNVRGSDNYKNRVAGIVIGREQAPPRAVEDMARALFADDPEPLDLTGAYDETTRGIRLRDGSAVAVRVQVHRDPRVQAVLEAVREDELTQVVDRLRLVHNAEPKRVYLVTNVPTDVTVDRVVTFNELLHEATGQLDNGKTGTGRRPGKQAARQAVRVVRTRTAAPQAAATAYPGSRDCDGLETSAATHLLPPMWPLLCRGPARRAVRKWTRQRIKPWIRTLSRC